MKKLALIIAASLTLGGCDFLDFDESQGKTQDEAYGYFDNVLALGNAAYRSLPDDFGDHIGGALREAATDNAVYTWESNAVYDIYNDVWSPLNQIDNKWSEYYQVIYDINMFLRDYSEENLERHKWDANYPDNIEKARMSLREVRVLRALYYFELVKRYGDVPLLTEPMELDEINSVTKTKATEILNFVATECASVADELPLSHNDFFGETGRVTKGAALAIRARALLYAASPLLCDGDASAAWKAAAEAAHDVIAMNYYSLPAIDEDPLYDPNLGDAVLKSPQLIFETRNNASLTFETRNLPIGFANGTNSGNTPTQNLVDEFEMKDGTPFSWNNATHVQNMYYDKAGNPTRDPRFYRTVLANGMKFMKTQIDTYEGGRFGAPVTGATLTGYYLKKLVNETVVLTPPNTVSKNHHFPTYRYAEVLLNYAEALNEWKGPDYTDANCTISARQALNQVRQAAGMPDVKGAGDQNSFRTAVRHERRVELAFEDHRFWDIRRWKIGNVVEQIYGVHIRKNGPTFEYTRQLVQNRIWKDKMYLYPIPQNETFVNPNLTQNPGWE